MIRTLCTLTPATKADGGRCLKGELSRQIVTIDEHGNRRTYPAGTPLILKKGKADVYSLLAQLPDDPPIGVDEHQQARARKHEQENLPAGFIPY